MFDTCWGNEPITQYLINGHFVWRPLGPVFPVEYRNPAGTPPGDYVGLNFYSRCDYRQRRTWVVLRCCMQRLARVHGECGT